MRDCRDQTVLSLLFGCLTCLLVTSYVNADGKFKFELLSQKNTQTNHLHFRKKGVKPLTLSDTRCLVCLFSIRLHILARRVLFYFCSTKYFMQYPKFPYVQALCNGRAPNYLILKLVPIKIFPATFLQHSQWLLWRDKLITLVAN